MDVLVRLYASYRETAGLDRVTLPLDDGAVVADAVQALLAAARRCRATSSRTSSRSTRSSATWRTR